MKRIHISLIGLFFLLFVIYSLNSALAKTEMQTPRFVSLKSSEVNVRTGPGLRYRIKWIIVKKNLPVEVVAEFEQWRKIRDIEGDEGWVHKSMLSGKRSAIIIGNETKLLYKLPDTTSRAVVFIEPSVVTELMSCKMEWCRIKSEGKKGWVMRKYLWGVYPEEEFD